MIGQNWNKILFFKNLKIEIIHKFAIKSRNSKDIKLLKPKLYSIKFLYTSR